MGHRRTRQHHQGGDQAARPLRDQRRQTDYVWHDTLPSLLTDVQTSTVDVGIAGITITKDREQVLDFSYPMFSAGLEVLTIPRGSSSNWTSELASFLTAGEITVSPRVAC
ncbi:MAG: transporter substrate-binding domain-containing protein [Pseudonocardiaceae bacterium]